MRDERNRILQALLDSEHIPTGMELWPAADSSAWNIIDSYLTQCDYYVLIIGGRYGSISNETGKSFTEIEYDRAVDLGVPVLAFPHGQPGKIPVEKTDSTPEAKEKLKAFIQRVTQCHYFKEWENADQLQYLVSNALQHAVKRHPRKGWVRADHAVDPGIYKDLEEARREVTRLTAELRLIAATAPESATSLAGLDAHRSIQYTGHFEQRVYQSTSSYASYDHKRVDLKLHKTYGGLFCRLGFCAWSGATTDQIEYALAQMCVDDAKPAALANGDDWHVASASVHKSDCHQVILHFLGLGLFQAAGDLPSTPLWVLTPYGRSRLVELMGDKRR
ncbi:MAG: DUF4062 domain-containing protein [Phycisphaerales bacterium]|nr:DUF4062 domain-containing protein [Phycisphaerales bacterium]